MNLKKDFEVVAANSPLIINVSEHRKANSIVCTPVAATYSVEYSCTPNKRGLTPKWVADANITAATTQKTAEYGKIARIRVTLTSGTSVSVDLL